MPTPVTGREPRRTGPRQAAWLLLCWLLVTGAVLAGGLLLTGPLADVVGPEDDAVPRWFAAHRSASLTEVASGVTFLGDTVTALVLTAVLLLVLWRWLRQRRAAVFLAVVGAGELATYLLTVDLVHRRRPPVPRLDPGLDPLHSYPSGHVAGAMATYGGLAVVLWVLRWRARHWTAPLLLALPVAIAVARLYLGVHHPTDVVASLLFMAVWLRCCVVLLPAAPAET